MGVVDESSAFRRRISPKCAVMWVLAIVVCAVLGWASVWMGSLNQDEGWYVYAANLVSQGEIPYRDFSYTQGPMLPFVYSVFAGIWKTFGLLGARVFTLSLGLIGILLAVTLVRRYVPPAKRSEASLAVFLLLATNLYHLYYLTIPKTYALAGLFVVLGFVLLPASDGLGSSARRFVLSLASGLALAFAAGTRISLGAIMPVVGLALLLMRRWSDLIGFCVGGFGGLALVYGPFVIDPAARAGLLAAQAYHAARGGSDIVWTVGSLSRLVRWYLPVFIVLGLGVSKVISLASTSPVDFRNRIQRVASLPLFAFLAVFAVQILAPFPYEDYQVPIMSLLTIFAVASFLSQPCEIGAASGGAFERLLMILGMSFAVSFGSPLLEKWSINGQDRFWSLKKDKTELAQLQDAAETIRSLDPNGTTLLTQDLYLAIETNRRVPKGLEMGPFAMMADAEWRKLLSAVECPVAALSGYTFAIEPPACGERPLAQQMDYWSILKSRYSLVEKVENFGQNATPLLILKRKAH